MPPKRRLPPKDAEASWLNVDASGEASSWSHSRDLREQNERRELREKNKRLRGIYDEANLSYGADVSRPTVLAQRTKVALELRQSQVQIVLKRMKAAQNLDLCFLVDVTASMGSHIEGVRNAIRGIVSMLTSSGDVQVKTEATTEVVEALVKKLRIAFVGYRDFGYDKQFEVLDFTDSLDTFHAFCASISIIRDENGDRAEDVFGGLDKANELKWTTDGSTRVLFHIADMPCHGNEFHPDFPKDPTCDRYPDGDPQGRSIKRLLDQLSAKNIDYHFGKIRDYTDKMVEKFAEIYDGGILTCDIKNPELICDSVVFLATVAVTKVGGRSARRASAYKGQFVTVEPNWDLLPSLNGILFSYELPESIEDIISGLPLTPKRPAKAKLKSAENPFACGVERVAYYGHDLSADPINPQEVILKKYTCSTGFTNSVLPYESSIQLQTIAAYMASVFTEEIVEKVGRGFAIKFLKTQVFTTRENDERVYMSCERRYPSNCKYLRFTNNVNFTMLEQTAKQNGIDLEFVRQMIAFSHWTYQVTKGNLMVVDLQGIISAEEKTFELTDPAIHCTDLTRFGKTNFGKDGMKCFFGRHKCNEICEKLGLVFPAEFIKAEPEVVEE